MLPKLEEIKIAVVGLGYVGLPLAIAFGKTNLAPVVGLDKDQQRIDALRAGCDPNKEISGEDFKMAKIEYTADPISLEKTNFIIVAVPTPITEARQPDLGPVIEASQIIGQHIKSGTTVVYESTVYPGVTEEICVSIIEKLSGLKCGVDWKVGYSPERTNPGDKEHTIETTIKVVSGIDTETLELVEAVYGKICKAGVHKAPNIKTAEAEKVIENTQRDLNIALINELSLIFHRIGINTRDVLEAAGTKWNFHKYQPGLVGGHCIGVDPYYLTFKAQELNYNPEVILAGRRINDWMPEYIADLTIRGLVEAGKVVQGADILIMGLTFKEDIRDIRNSKIYDTIKKLQSYGVHVFGHDPNLFEDEVKHFGVDYVSDLSAIKKIDGIILATLHKQFKAIQLNDLIQYYNGNNKGVLMDIKSWFLPQIKKIADQLPIIYKCL